MKTVSVDSEYEKHKGLRREDVLVLNEWAEKQPHLPKITELHLIFFLHSCYYSIEMAKATIECFFTYRTHCPELFLNKDPTSEKFQKTEAVIEYLPLAQKTPSGDQIIWFKFVDLDVEKFDINETLKMFDMTITQRYMQEGTADGLIIVGDFEGITLGHVLKLNIVTMRKILIYLQDALFVRLKAIHFINIGSYMDILMNVMKPFLKKDLVNSLHFHTESIKSLCQYVPLDCLPSEYGGSQPSLKEIHADWCKQLVDFREYFVNENSYVADDSKRVGKPNLSDIFGVEGSFKKLDID